MILRLGMVLAAYLIGSLPTGFLSCKWLKKIDIREHGSGNPGATNVFRVVGKTAGVITLLIDGVKGYLPVFLCLNLFPGDFYTAAAVGLAAIAGHNWTVWLGFKGGKGVATSAGVFLALIPWPTLAAIGVFLAVLAVSRHVSAGSLAASASLPISTWFLTRSLFMTGFAFLAAALVIFLHKKNIARLCRGEELNPVPKREEKHGA